MASPSVRMRSLLALAAFVGVLCLQLDGAVGPNGVFAADRRKANAARKAYESGAQALSTGRFAEAIGHFERCLEFQPRPPCAFNLAVAQRGSGDLLAAEENLKALIGGRWGRLPKTRRAEVRSFLQETTQNVATLELAIDAPVDFVVRLDGEQVAYGASPLRVNPGSHVVLVSADRYETIERAVELAPGESQSLALTLQPTRAALFGTLIVETENATDRIEVEGVGSSVGSYSGDLPPGRYTIRVTGEGGLQERAVDVEAGSTLRVALDGDESSLLSNPWFWAGTGVAVAGAVLAIIFFASEDAPPVVTSPNFPVTETLRDY